MKLTQRLIDASEAVTRIPPKDVPDYQTELLLSCRSRAREVTRYRAGTELDASQVEYLQMLRQRLQAFGAPTAATEWLDAFSEAYRAGADA